MRKGEPSIVNRKVVTRPDRDTSVPFSQTNSMRTGERKLAPVHRTSTYVPDRLRERVEPPSDDGDMYRPDQDHEELVC